MLRKVPLIVILGSTGTGKTKLSIQLAQKYGAEIISADSMQVYKGLSIATAKATREEQAQAPHHLIDITTPNEPFTVTHFRDLAMPIIDNLLHSSKIPIIVGGTNYYIESILWHNLVSPGVGKKRKCDNIDGSNIVDDLPSEVKEFIGNPSMILKMEEMESTALFEYLKQIDPTMAHRLHPKNKRKIMRAMEVFKDHGKRMSDLIEEQRRLPGASNLGGPRRYEDVLIFWLQCEQETLNKRLDARVNSMVNEGLLAEIRSFYDEFVVNRTFVDYEEGILQTIGFKEFIPYLEKFDKSHDILINNFVESASSTTQTTLTEDESSEPESYKSLLACLDQLKLATRRYSKKQLKWIRNRLLASDTRELPLVYPLDTSDVSLWSENVYLPAINTVESFLKGGEIKLRPLEKMRRLGEGLDEETSHFCDICERTFIGDFQWSLHLKSNKHKKVSASKRKKHLKAMTEETKPKVNPVNISKNEDTVNS